MRTGEVWGLQATDCTDQDITLVHLRHTSILPVNECHSRETVLSVVNLDLEFSCPQTQPFSVLPLNLDS